MRIICYKGEDILIFNLEINEKCELIINHFVSKKTSKNHLKANVKLN
jgi:hypothetical protein